MMKLEEKQCLPRFRIAVLGAPNVGKSALTVRYLTRRFIGEYRSNTDLLYKQTVRTENNGMLDVEIIDVSVDPNSDFPAEQIQWADACIIVYSITDKSSFQYASRVLSCIKCSQTNVSVLLIANKSDLDHLREVSEGDGASLGALFGVVFTELSVAENSTNVYNAFERLLYQSKDRPVKQRKFSVSKMIGTLMGNNNNNHSNENAAKKCVCSFPAPSIPNGTMVECSKGELVKPRVIKQRRQGFSIASSL